MREDAINACGAAADAAPHAWIRRMRRNSPWPFVLNALILVTDVLILATFVLASTSLLVNR